MQLLKQLIVHEDVHITQRTEIQTKLEASLSSFIHQCITVNLTSPSRPFGFLHAFAFRAIVVFLLLGDAAESFSLFLTARARRTLLRVAFRRISRRGFGCRTCWLFSPCYGAVVAGISAGQRKQVSHKKHPLIYYKRWRNRYSHYKTACNNGSRSFQAIGN